MNAAGPPGRGGPKKFRPCLRASRREGAPATAATSSSISDGAAALVLMKESDAKARGIKPLARIVGHASNAHEPQWFTTAPVGAIRKLQKSLDWSPKNVDLYEINEAFAVVAMAAMRELALPREQVNGNGGAC